MKTKEQLTEDAGLVRDMEAWAAARCADDYERKFRDSLFRKTFAALGELEIPHVRRINEALCDMDFPSAVALGLRRAVADRLARHHELRKYRALEMPLVTPPPQSA